ncbi:hypothetical protein [Coraliomargarita akajimensis]|uniref:Ysc84 actin-binding domain-containing protein n=1 Tax=Coraliomargarita akajimensis (strain DSM 45221 / IAM 15411 / JCM 23193 / KCTC 12865 / 04OKA010-24) TaxID=583355 RepID=D5EQ21_CORAD|nr:hypothetical protein [Coraliomargarita akajimensis]ADE55754.1 hypothetical protein Caka_2739 [Coraliomargarita akajimensis DSM 45221]
MSQVGCRSLSTEAQNEIVVMVDESLERFYQQDPELKTELTESLGYLLVDKKVVKIPGIGWGGGKGVVVANTDGARNFVKVSRLELGAGWGARSYKVLLLIDDPELLERMQEGTWVYGLGAEASAGTAAVEGTADQVKPDKEYTVHVLSDGGASATFTLRAIRVRPYSTR